MIDILNKGWVGSCLGLLGIIFAYYFYRKSLRIPVPKISFMSDHAISWPGSEEFPPGIQVLFEDKTVPRVARSVIRIWNSGTGCLTKDLISEHDNLKFSLENGGEFLAVSLLKQSSSASNCNVQINQDKLSEAHVTFDFLNHDDGMVIGLIHTDKNPRPTFKGTLKGYQFKVTEDINKAKLQGSQKWLFPLFRAWIPILLGSLSIILGLLNQEHISYIKSLFIDAPAPCLAKSFSYYSRIFLIFVGTSYVLFGLKYFWNRRSAYPKTLTFIKNN